jgi:very-short-patch-repair endonuclease
MRGRVARTESELERAFLALVRAAGIPEPIAQAHVAGYRVDLFWPGPRPLVVELDSYEFHKSRAKFESDRRRDAKLQVAIDCYVLRVTWECVEQEPCELIAEVQALLRAGRGGGEGASGR